MAKISAYQKLKQENERLRKNIDILVLKPNSIEGICLKRQVRIMHETEKAIWSGEPFSDANNKFTGIFSKILSNDANEKEIEFAKDYAANYTKHN